MEPAIELTCLPGYHFSSKSARPSDHEISDLQALIEDSEQEFPENELPGRYWTSIWLRKPTLLALIALFTALVASLVVLLVVEQDDDGIRSTLSSNHYVWTYGPTAVLVIVLSLWRQVDYYCKLMQPWQEMSKSPKDADNSLLLDYISPPLLTSWVQAVQRRHIPVAASVAGFAIMKLIILFSTGLLVLTPTTVTGLQNITLTTAFAADAFWNTVHSNGTIRADSAYARTYIGVSAEPVYAYVKLLIDQSHEPYSSVLANTMVFQSFEPEETTELLSIITEVDAFVPNISCEIAQTTFRQLSDDDDDDDNNDEDDPDSDSDSDADPDSDDDDLAVRQLSDANFADFQSPDRNLAVRLNSTTCSVGAENQTQLALQGNPVYCPNDTCPSSFIQYYFWRVNCSDVGDSYSYTTVDIDTPYDFRFALLVSNFTTQTLSSDQGNGIQQNVTPGGTAAVICKVDYSVDRATILQDMADGSVRVQHLTASRQLNNFTSIMLGELIHDALWASQDLDMRDHIGYRQDLKTTAQVTVPLYYVLLRSLIGEQSMNQFLSAETLHSSASQVWAGIVSQFVQESLVMAKNARSTANATFVEPRLHVGLVSLWAMVAGFVLLIVLTICIMFTTRNNVVPQDPGYLATSSSLMITSPSMTGLLNVCGNLRTTQLANLLSVFEFKTKCDHGFRIKATTKRHRILKRTSEEKQYHKATAWVPLAAQYLMIGLTLAVPMVAIVVLEILYSISYRSHGLLDVYDKEQMATYLSRYLSSSIVLSIATMFNSLDFTIASFAPYSLLRSGAVPASRSLYFNLLGKLGPVALWNSIEAHHASSAFSNSAGTIGSALTIVSSGLWVINRTVVMEIATTASLADTWDVSWYNSSGSGDGGASFSFDTFQHGGTALPPSSWHDIVFPNITDIRLSSAAYVPGDSRTQNITIQLQGLRPYLDCQVIADENLDIDFSDVEHDQITISAQPPLPLGCQHAGENGTSAYYNFSRTFPLNARYMSAFYDLHLGPWTKYLQQDYDETSYGRFYSTDNQAGCPSIGILFAKNRATNTSYDDVSALMCSQKIEKVKLNVTYLAQDMMHPSINTKIEPVIIGGPAEYMTNGTPGIESFPYRVEIYFQKLTFFTTDDHSALDEFMNSLTNGPNRTSLEDLGGKANRGRFTEAVGDFYARYMSFVIDQRFRQPISQNSTNTTNQVTGTTYRHTSRLQMNFASKLALQIMLATMTILGASAFWLVDLRGTLPRKPTTIASSLALFAGSDMCDEKKPLIPREVLWKQGKELDKVFDGWLFSLGWWPTTRKTGGGVSEGGGEMSGDALLGRKEVEGRRFGIDVGVAEQLGFR